ncbi:MAG: helix-turn-helix transcriptional regulator [Bacteroidia bacterium]|nr:helix-turn-helix transcriptional regulator [Bacteroidia bacterium]
MSEPELITADVTPREIEIVKMLAEGYNSRQISFHLFISEHTVHTHRRNIVKKLGVKNVAHLVHYSWQNGLFNRLNEATMELRTQSS